MQKFDSKNPLAHKKISSLLLSFAIPSIIAMLVNALYNMVDQIFIGNKFGFLGNAATNVAFPLTTISTAFALLLGHGGASKQNLELGAGNKEKAEKTVGTVLILSLIISSVLLIGEASFLAPLLKFFGATEEVYPYAYGYTKIIILGLPFMLFSTAINNTIRADGSPTYAMASMLFGAVLNTILDPIFLFVFDMGIEGAAIATVIGQFIGFVISVVYLPKFKHIKLTRKCLKLDFSLSRVVFVLGIASFFNQLAMASVQVVLNNSIAYYGALSEFGSDIPLACIGIMMKVNMIFLSIVIGIGQGCQPIASFNYGARQFERVKETFKTAVRYSTYVSIVFFLLFQIFPRQIMYIFGEGSETYFVFAEKCFRIYLFASFVNGLQPVTTGFFTSIGKGIKGMFIALTRQVIFLMPLIIILPLFWGIDGIMYAAPLADFGAFVTAMLFVRKEFKDMDKLSLENN